MDIITRKVAQGQGLKTYYTGKPCKRNHVVSRHVSNGTCMLCANADNRTNYYSKGGKPRKPDKFDAKAYQKEYKRIHRSDTYFSIRKRKGQIKQATVFPHEKDELNRIYRERPKGSHVDHEIPLNHELVCGLHCVANLQYLTAEDNLKKSNQFTNI